MCDKWVLRGIPGARHWDGSSVPGQRGDCFIPGQRVHKVLRWNFPMLSYKVLWYLNYIGYLRTNKKINLAAEFSFAELKTWNIFTEWNNIYIVLSKNDRSSFTWDIKGTYFQICLEHEPAINYSWKNYFQVNYSQLVLDHDKTLTHGVLL